ncbi:MAG: hypothetical protein RBG13Loki_2744 [Promethearchaeota archaeon CR_4]|nr:MAG: hypothetical protein RBG13Loki_2744 [Candidatus Lokiarchaeota archaeon CR_4]
MATIPIQFSDEDLKKIDYLVKIGRYKNRSQAIKTIVEERLTRETLQFDFENSNEDETLHGIVAQLKELPRVTFRILGEKSAAEIVSEERER